MGTAASGKMGYLTLGAITIVMAALVWNLWRLNHK
jgi:hypothetical protein